MILGNRHSRENIGKQEKCLENQRGSLGLIFGRRWKEDPPLGKGTWTPGIVPANFTANFTA